MNVFFRFETRIPGKSYRLVEHSGRSSQELDAGTMSEVIHRKRADRVVLPRQRHVLEEQSQVGREHIY